MPTEPLVKRTIAFIDGQNLFHAVKEAFGYTFPNYDVAALATAITSAQGWQLDRTRFYTGVPEAADDATWNHFWIGKLAAMGRTGVEVASRPLRYRNQLVNLPGGGTHSILVGQEKGIDVRIALDVVSCARRGDCDVVLVFSQDQDLREVADEIRAIAREHDRWIKIASAFPISPTRKNCRGIDRTDWVRIDRATYDSCIDRTDYRPKRSSP